MDVLATPLAVMAVTKVFTSSLGRLLQLLHAINHPCDFEGSQGSYGLNSCFSFIWDAWDTCHIMENVGHDHQGRALAQEDG